MNISMNKEMLRITGNFGQQLNHFSKNKTEKNWKLNQQPSNCIDSDKGRLLLNAFVTSQFSYSPLNWIFCTRESYYRLNWVHGRALRGMLHVGEVKFTLEWNFNPGWIFFETIGWNGYFDLSAWYFMCFHFIKM